MGRFSRWHFRWTASLQSVRGSPSLPLTFLPAFPAVTGFYFCPRCSSKASVLFLTVRQFHPLQIYQEGTFNVYSQVPGPKGLQPSTVQNGMVLLLQGAAVKVGGTGTGRHLRNHYPILQCRCSSRTLDSRCRTE